MKKLFTGTFVLWAGAALQAQVLYNNGATVYIGTTTSLQVNGNLVNNTGSVTNNGILATTGNITNNATMATPTAGVLQITGTTTQTLSGSTPVVAKNVVINNAAGVTLATPLRIDGAASFTSGLITATNSSYPVIFTSNGLVSGVPTDASHVNGYVVKEGTGAFTFPLGNATNYQPVAVNLTANSGGLTALYVPGDAGAAPFGTTGTEATPLAQYNYKEYWNLTPVGTATGTVTVYYDNYLAPTITGNPADIRVAHKLGGQWLNEGRASGSTSTTAAGAITSNAISNWSPFAIGAISKVILPVQWVSLSGAINFSKAASLNWSVAETNVKQYDIEKSPDASSYTTIGSVVSKGNGTHTYAFAENGALIGTAYYRIRQTDVNGRQAYSAIVKLSAGGNVGVSAYPNPVKNAVVISVPSGLVGSGAGLFNVSGQRLQNLLITKEVFLVNLNDYKPGVYLLQFTNGEVFRLVKE